MSDWTASALQSLAQDVHPVYGGVSAHSLDSAGRLRLDLRIPPAEDLHLHPHLDFRFRLLVPPPSSSSSSSSSSTSSPAAVPIVQLSGEDQVALLEPHLARCGASIVPGERGDLPRLTFSWLDTSKYGLGVWVFAVRSLLLSPDYKPWYTPPPFLRHFTTKGVDRSPLLLLCGAGAARGRRPYMEDVHCCFPAVNISGGGSNVCSVYGVLDGHGGVECSRFAVEEMPPQIVAALRSGLSSSQALFNSFTNTDEEFISSTTSKAGTTATVLLWNHATGIANLANAGDSRAVMRRGGIAVDVARDMKATDSCEIARIARAGGHVSNGRVNGSLAIARAIGDKSLKKGSSPALTAEPEIVTFRFQEDDEFLLIASDGLWDVMTSQAAVDMAADMLQKSDVLSAILGDKGKFRGSDEEIEQCQEELKKIGDFMAHNACDVLNSQDNITVMLIVVKRHSTDSQKRDGFQYPEIRVCPENHPHSVDDELHCGSTGISGQDLRSFDRSGVEREEGRRHDVPRVSQIGNYCRDEIYNTPSTTVEVSCSAIKDSVDDDDDVMNFLLDDSNF